MLEFLVGSMILALLLIMICVYEYLCDKFGQDLIFMIGILLATAYVIGNAVLH